MSHPAPGIPLTLDLLTLADQAREVALRANDAFMLATVERVVAGYVGAPCAPRPRIDNIDVEALAGYMVVQVSRAGRVSFPD